MEKYNYVIKGTVIGSRCYDDYTEEISAEELAEYLMEISAMFSRGLDDELAQYINEDFETGIKESVTEIWVNVKVIDGEMYSWTEVTTNRELTENEKSELLEYLTGQFSDGFGEGLEQQEFESYTNTDINEGYDEDTQEYYMDEEETEVYMYLHLWNSKDFKLEFVDEGNYKSDKASPEKSEAVKPRCKLIGEDGNIFNLMGLASRALRKAKLEDKSKEMCDRITHSESYSMALSIIMEYVDAY